ncbi:hypothetical protein FOL47_006272, partial [Perkinsus chesapeaki]
VTADEIACHKMRVATLLGEDIADQKCAGNESITSASAFSKPPRRDCDASPTILATNAMTEETERSTFFNNMERAAAIPGVLMTSTQDAYDRAIHADRRSRKSAAICAVLL